MVTLDILGDINDTLGKCVHGRLRASPGKMENALTPTNVRHYAPSVPMISPQRLLVRAQSPKIEFGFATRKYYFPDQHLRKFLSHRRTGLKDESDQSDE